MDTKREVFIRIANNYLCTLMHETYKGRMGCVKSTFGDDDYDCENGNCAEHKRIFYERQLNELISEYDNAN